MDILQKAILSQTYHKIINVANVFIDLNFQLEQKYVYNYEIHEFQKCEPTNSYGLLNDQIWNLFSKVPILIMFC